MKTRKRKRLRGARRTGAACLEFAMTASLLVLITLGCVDFGRFVYAYVTVNNAAREGANFGSLNGIAKFGSVNNWRTAVTNAAVAETTQISITQGNVTVNTPTGTNPARVSVQVVHQFNMTVTWPGLPASVTLTRSVVMPITH